MKAEELADLARREAPARQRRLTSDSDLIVKAMAQLAVQGGETAAAGWIQAVLHELLREFGQRAEFEKDTRVHGTTALSAFIGAQVEMLDKATTLLHSHPRHPKAQRTAFGRMITAPAQRSGAAGTPTGYPLEQTPDSTTARGAASIRKTLGWITASSVAEVKTTEQAAAFGRVAAHFDPATHYQGASGAIHPLPPGCGPSRLLSVGNTVTVPAGFEPRRAPIAQTP